MVKQTNDYMSKGLRKMGLAASQARFLCITARKADCEYKSTELAQQKLEITNQLSDISTEYSNAMNATKLMWSNDAVDGDFSMSYGLLMTPSVANDYNPYMVTTASGAIVLNSEYAAAAKAAGISKAGGIGSQDSRDKFIAALSYQGLITDTTSKAITRTDYEVDTDKTAANNKITFKTNPTTATSGVDWNPAAGMGAIPKNKNSVAAMTLSDIINSSAIGQKTIDWAKVSANGKTTKKEYTEETSRLQKLVSKAQTGNITDDIVNQLKRDKANYMSANPAPDSTDTEKRAKYDADIKKFDELITQASYIQTTKADDKGNITYTYKDANGNKQEASFNKTTALNDIKAQLQSDLDTYEEAHTAGGVDFKDTFNTSANSLASGKNGGKTFSVVENGVINHYADEISSISIGDILSNQVVLMSNNTDLTAFKQQVVELLNSIVGVFGYSKSEDLTGQGLNVDEASAKALKFAYDMVIATYLNTKAVERTGNRTSDKSTVDNSAYQNAVDYNRIGSDNENDGKGTYCAVSLTNMLNSFLTYYENSLTGADSPYVVGKSVKTSQYVTDNSGYTYIGQDDEDSVTEADKKSADFFDEVYNNILEHGWREDASIDDSEYLENAIKNGNYSMSSLNNDGYYYQTRYNETGYVVEVSDKDAIARAEAEFTSKKAELTYKEDSIDLKTKQLDAEISSLSTEYDTVKSLISKSIEKTFAMFSN